MITPLMSCLMTRSSSRCRWPLGSPALAVCGAPGSHTNSGALLCRSQISVNAVPSNRSLVVAISDSMSTHATSATLRPQSSARNSAGRWASDRAQYPRPINKRRTFGCASCPLLLFTAQPFIWPIRSLEGEMEGVKSPTIQPSTCSPCSVLPRGGVRRGGGRG